MKIDILTLFPEFFGFLNDYGVIGRSIRKGLLEVQTTNIRDFATGKHKSVDDTVFGGASGMLMMPGPIVDAMDAVTEESGPGRRIFLSPQGQVLTQKKAIELASYDHLILLCGHYEGIDARVTNHFIDEEISIGDYVLTGGELPAMVLIDTVSRWIDGVLGNAESAGTDSFAQGLLQYDEYTKPRSFRGYEVPEVLLSGNHGEIERWREENSIENTRRKRPDILSAIRNNTIDQD